MEKFLTFFLSNRFWVYVTGQSFKTLPSHIYSEKLLNNVAVEPEKFLEFPQNSINLQAVLNIRNLFALVDFRTNRVAGLTASSKLISSFLNNQTKLWYSCFGTRWQRLNSPLKSCFNFSFLGFSHALYTKPFMSMREPFNLLRINSSDNLLNPERHFDLPLSVVFAYNKLYPRVGVNSFFAQLNWKRSSGVCSVMAGLRPNSLTLTKDVLGIFFYPIYYVIKTDLRPDLTLLECIRGNIDFAEFNVSFRVQNLLVTYTEDRLARSYLLYMKPMVYSFLQWQLTKILTYTALNIFFKKYLTLNSGIVFNIFEKLFLALWSSIFQPSLRLIISNKSSRFLDVQNFVLKYSRAVRLKKKKYKPAALNNNLYIFNQTELLGMFALRLFVNKFQRINSYDLNHNFYRGATVRGFLKTKKTLLITQNKFLFSNSLIFSTHTGFLLKKHGPQVVFADLNSSYGNQFNYKFFFNKYLPWASFLEYGSLVKAHFFSVLSNRVGTILCIAPPVTNSNYVYKSFLAKCIYGLFSSRKFFLKTFMLSESTNLAHKLDWNRAFLDKNTIVWVLDGLCRKHDIFFSFLARNTEIFKKSARPSLISLSRNILENRVMLEKHLEDPLFDSFSNILFRSTFGYQYAHNNVFNFSLLGASALRCDTASILESPENKLSDFFNSFDAMSNLQITDIFATQINVLTSQILLPFFVIYGSASPKFLVHSGIRFRLSDGRRLRYILTSNLF